MNREDPIVEEVRATRERLVREAGGFDAYIARLKAREPTEDPHVVSSVMKHTTVMDSAKCAEVQTTYSKRP